MSSGAVAMASYKYITKLIDCIEGIRVVCGGEWHLNAK